MNGIHIKLTEAQKTALETAGVFEEPLDEDDRVLALAIQGEYLVTNEPQKLAGLMYELSNAADDHAEQRAPCDDATLRRAYRADCQVFLRLARKLMCQVQL